MKRAIAIVLSAAVASTVLPASRAAAQDCSSSVQSAQDNVRNGFIQGMSGLITGSFSNRPSSFASMACLDKFMQGNMDIMFKPPSLTDLLGTVMNFACQTQAASTPSASSLNLNSLIGSLAGGLNLGGASGGTVNLSQILSSATSATSAGGAGSTGGISGLYTVPGH